MIYRAKHMTLNVLYNQVELNELIDKFTLAAADKQSTIGIVQMMNTVLSLGFEVAQEEIEAILALLSENEDETVEHVDFDLFARTVAVLLEEQNKVIHEEAEEGEDQDLDESYDPELVD